MTNVDATALRGLAFASYHRGELTCRDLEERLAWIRQRQETPLAPAPPRQRQGQPRRCPHRAG